MRRLVAKDVRLVLHKELVDKVREIRGVPMVHWVPSISNDLVDFGWVCGIGPRSSSGTTAGPVYGAQGLNHLMINVSRDCLLSHLAAEALYVSSSHTLGHTLLQDGELVLVVLVELGQG